MRFWTRRKENSEVGIEFKVSSAKTPRSCSGIHARARVHREGSTESATPYPFGYSSIGMLHIQHTLSHQGTHHSPIRSLPGTNAPTVLKLRSNLVGSNGRCYVFKKLIQERPHFGRVWLASFEQPPYHMPFAVTDTPVDPEVMISY